MSYHIELVWNREFHWVPYGRAYDTLEEAKAAAESIANSGDGARVKKARVVDNEGKVVG